MLKHLLPERYLVSNWSGGTTTQIAIAPEDAVYGEHTFLWRISSAEVTLDASDFTPLPDYERYLSVLKGEMTLWHDGGAPIKLEPGRIHCFDGGAKTHSQGRCTDFNLMVRKGACGGSMEYMALGDGEEKAVAVRAQMLLYCVRGSARILSGGGNLLLAEGESVFLEHANTAIVTGCGEAVLIAAQMWALDCKTNKA